MYLACLIWKAHRSKCVGCSLRKPLDVKKVKEKRKTEHQTALPEILKQKLIILKNEGIIEHWSVNSHLRKPESQQGVERKR